MHLVYFAKKFHSIWAGKYDISASLKWLKINTFSYQKTSFLLKKGLPYIILKTFKYSNRIFSLQVQDVKRLYFPSVLSKQTSKHIQLLMLIVVDSCWQANTLGIFVRYGFMFKAKKAHWIGKPIEQCEPGPSSRCDHTSWFLLPFCLELQRICDHDIYLI